MSEERNTEALNDLLEKVIYSEKIYERAAKSVHSEPFRKKLSKIAEERARYKKKIEQEIIERDGSPESANRVRLMMDELYMMFSDLHIQKNVPDLLQMCMKADEELLDQHVKLMKQEHFVKENDPLAQLLYGEYDQVKRLSGEFNKELEAYTWR